MEGWRVGEGERGIDGGMEGGRGRKRREGGRDSPLFVYLTKATNKIMIFPKGLGSARWKY